MKNTRKLVTLVLLMALTQIACYNQHFISTTQLAKLEATVEQKQAVSVIIEGCDSQNAPKASRLAPEVDGTLVAQDEGVATDAPPAESPAPAAPAAEGAAAPTEDGIDPATGCPTVVVNTASPLNVVTQNGQRLRVTPFNFAVTDTQLVSPDYDLLLAIDDVAGAEIQTFSGWKTAALITGALSVGVGLFVGIALTAGEERGLGEQ